MTEHRITDMRTVKTTDRMRMLPFLYVLTYIPYVICAWIGGSVWYMANEILFVSPAICLLTLWAGWRMRFCVWWKMQCLLPVLPAIMGTMQHYGMIHIVTPYLITILIIVAGSIINGVMVYNEGVK